jgi:hypothetical protein
MKSTRLITALGESLSVSEWSEKTGLSIRIINYRLSKNWPNERAVSQSAINGNNQFLVH